jgi:heme exporter protein A
MLAGLLLPYEGSISWNEFDIHQHRFEYHEQLLYIGHQVALKPELNAIENLSSLLLLQGNNPSLTEIKQALEKWLILGNTIHLPTKQLSQGQKQRVALAQLTLSSHALWILDEPFNGLDAQGTNILIEHLAQHHAVQKITVITSHLHNNLQSILPSLLAQEKILEL